MNVQVGQAVMCNGFHGVVRKVCEGQLAGMAEIQLGRGMVCASISELSEYRLERTRWQTQRGRYQMVVTQESDGTWSVREYERERQTGGIYNLATEADANSRVENLRKIYAADGININTRTYEYTDGRKDVVVFRD